MSQKIQYNRYFYYIAECLKLIFIKVTARRLAVFFLSGERLKKKIMFVNCGTWYITSINNCFSLKETSINTNGMLLNSYF